MRYKDTRVIAIYFAARTIWGAIQVSPRYSDILDIAMGKICTHSIVVTSVACSVRHKRDLKYEIIEETSSW